MKHEDGLEFFQAVLCIDFAGFGIILADNLVPLAETEARVGIVVHVARFFKLPVVNELV